MFSVQFFSVCSKSSWPLLGRNICTRPGVTGVALRGRHPHQLAGAGGVNLPACIGAPGTGWTAAGTDVSLFKSRSIPPVRRGGAWCTCGRGHMEEERRVLFHDEKQTKPRRDWPMEQTTKNSVTAKQVDAPVIVKQDAEKKNLPFCPTRKKLWRSKKEHEINSWRSSGVVGAGGH